MSSIENIVADCFFAPQPCLHQQVYYLIKQPKAYLEALETLSTKGILSTVSQATKARVLIALCACKQYTAFVHFLHKCDVVEISKACESLDRPRLIRQKEAKIALIRGQHPHLKEEGMSGEGEMEVESKERKRPEKRRKKSGVAVLCRQVKELKAQEQQTHCCETCAVAHADSAVKEVLASASLSGALALKIRKWAGKFPPDFLEFIVLSGSMSVWRKLADIVHFAPTDFSLPYFLSVTHGNTVPEGTFVHGMRRLMEASKKEMAAQFAELGAQFPQLYKSFTFLRTQPQLLADRSIAENLAHHIPLGTAIWYLEELCQASRHTIANILTKRLQTEPNWMEEDEDSKVAASFAKLVERIKVAQSISPELATALLPAARMRLGALKEITDMPGDTLTIGDASASMQTAIDSATILAAMISVCWGGELCFFSSDYIASPFPRPKTVEEVLEITRRIRANSCTSVAAGLWPVYNKNIVYQRIVLVTDEEENTACHGMMFAQLFRKYKDELNPTVELLLVGVGSGDHHFQESLRRLDIPFKRVEIDNRRPDLTKFDALLRQMSLLAASETPAAKAQVFEMEEEFVVVEDGDMA